MCVPMLSFGVIFVMSSEEKLFRNQSYTMHNSCAFLFFGERCDWIQNFLPRVSLFEKSLNAVHLSIGVHVRVKRAHFVASGFSEIRIILQSKSRYWLFCCLLSGECHRSLRRNSLIHRLALWNLQRFLLFQNAITKTIKLEFFNIFT